MNSSHDHIAGWKTAEDWKHIRQELIDSPNADLWGKAFDDFFHTRLSLRYLEPIRMLQENGTLRGEGFSIVTIQCSLVEFLESTLEGTSYRFLRKGETLGKYEYSSSSEIFVRFLSTRQPFSKEFDNDLAHDFYVGVRCGLLHEARTNNHWRIWASDSTGRIVNRTDKIVFRDNYQSALLSFVVDYRRQLQINPDFQKAFIRKFDNLCE